MLHSLTARYTLRQFAPHLNPGYASHMSAKIVKDTSMTYDNLMTTILRAGRKDWLFHEPLKTYTFKPDLDIQIRMRPDSPNRQSFVEDWTKVLTQPQANLKTFDIYYRSSIIESFNLASVDEAKAHIPLPEPGSNKISRRDYQLATQVDAADSLDAYIQRSGLKIQG
jgi:hypothetical protein